MSSSSGGNTLHAYVVATVFGATATVVPEWVASFSDKLLIGASVALVSGFAYKAGAAGYEYLASRLRR